MFDINDRAARALKAAGGLLLAAGLAMAFTWGRFAALLPTYQFFFLASVALVGKPLLAVDLYRTSATSLDERKRVWRVIFLLEPVVIAAVAVAWWVSNPTAIVGAGSGR